MDPIFFFEPFMSNVPPRRPGTSTRPPPQVVGKSTPMGDISGRTRTIVA
jgi:hypothetical protein